MYVEAFVTGSLSKFKVVPWKNTFPNAIHWFLEYCTAARFCSLTAHVSLLQPFVLEKSDHFYSSYVTGSILET
jgi:hypothetical protein